MKSQEDCRISLRVNLENGYLNYHLHRPPVRLKWEAAYFDVFFLIWQTTNFICTSCIQTQTNASTFKINTPNFRKHPFYKL